MATTVSTYNLFKQGQVNGDHPVDFTASTFTLTLHTSSYVPNLDTHEFYDDLTNELGTAGNYTAGGQDLTGTSLTLDTGNDFVYFDADDVTWAALTATFRYAVLRQNTGLASTDVLILLIDFGENKAPSSEDFIVQWAAPSAGAVLKVA
jgi:hypothetical protein